MTTVQPSTAASTATPCPRDQHGPTALYRLYGNGGTLLYIGISGDPDRRFKQHRDAKSWWSQVAKKTIEWHPTRVDALAAEAAAIEAETPIHNIDHNPAAPSYHWPPTGMPTDQVDVIEREASKLPADLAEGIRRAAFEGFTRARLADQASTPTGQHAGRDKLIAALPAAVDEAMQATLPHRYTPELAAEIAATAIGLLTGTVCPVYPGLCTDTQSGHYDHFNHQNSVIAKDGEHLLDVGFVENSGGSGPLVYIAGASSEDLRPEDVRAKTAELRRLLDQADEMADKVIAMTAVHQGEQPEVQA